MWFASRLIPVFKRIQAVVKYTGHWPSQRFFLCDFHVLKRFTWGRGCGEKEVSLKCSAPGSHQKLPSQCGGEPCPLATLSRCRAGFRTGSFLGILGSALTPAGLGWAGRAGSPGTEVVSLCSSGRQWPAASDRTPRAATVAPGAWVRSGSRIAVGWLPGQRFGV